MRVQVEYLSSYTMPPVCVGCGARVAPFTYEVGKTNMSGKQGVSLKFPICAQCKEASKVQPGWLGCLGGIVAAIIGFGIGGSLGEYLPGDLTGILAMGGAFLGLIGGIQLSHYLVVSRKSPEMRERIERLDKSVRMIGFELPSLFGSKGWIKLEFSDPAYGNQFRVLNAGKV